MFAISILMCAATRNVNGLNAAIFAQHSLADAGACVKRHSSISSTGRHMHLNGRVHSPQRIMRIICKLSRCQNAQASIHSKIDANRVCGLRICLQLTIICTSHSAWTRCSIWMFVHLIFFSSLVILHDNYNTLHYDFTMCLLFFCFSFHFSIACERS